MEELDSISLECNLLYLLNQWRAWEEDSAL
jgi:hypothetical protein